MPPEENSQENIKPTEPKKGRIGFIKILIISIIVGAIQVSYDLFLTEVPINGWVAMSDTIEMLLIIVAISFVLGVVGLVSSLTGDFSWGKKLDLVRGISWFGISLVIIISLNIAVKPIRERQWDLAHPRIQNINPCEPGFIGTQSCEEWRKNYKPPKPKKYSSRPEDQLSASPLSGTAPLKVVFSLPFVEGRDAPGINFSETSRLGYEPEDTMSCDKGKNVCSIMHTFNYPGTYTVHAIFENSVVSPISIKVE